MVGHDKLSMAEAYNSRHSVASTEIASGRKISFFSTT